VFFRLEAEGFECVLADARQVKNLPGRPKRDTTDSQWLACCFERGSVFACFVATPEFRIIRLHTRRRRDLTGERAREKQRAEKLLEDAAIKVSSVLTDLHGVTGREIMDRLIAGERDPKALAECDRTPRPPQDPPAACGAGGRGVLHSPSRRAAEVHPEPDRLGHRRDRRAVRRDRGTAGPVPGAAGAGRVDARLGPPRRPGRHRRVG
jgi:hypothetical protein